MAKKLSYNMHAAINMRGQTFTQAGLGNPFCYDPADDVKTIDFRTSIEATGGDYDWGNIPLHVEVLMGLHSYELQQMRRTTRDKWRKAYQGWRKYIHQSYHQAPNLAPTTGELL